MQHYFQLGLIFYEEIYEYNILLNLDELTLSVTINPITVGFKSPAKLKKVEANPLIIPAYSPNMSINATLE